MDIFVGMLQRSEVLTVCPQREQMSEVKNPPSVKIWWMVTFDLFTLALSSVAWVVLLPFHLSVFHFIPTISSIFSTLCDKTRTGGGQELIWTIWRDCRWPARWCAPCTAPERNKICHRPSAGYLSVQVSEWDLLPMSNRPPEQKTSQLPAGDPRLFLQEPLWPADAKALDPKVHSYHFFKWLTWHCIHTSEARVRGIAETILHELKSLERITDKIIEI